MRQIQAVADRQFRPGGRGELGALGSPHSRKQVGWIELHSTFSSSLSIYGSAAIPFPGTWITPSLDIPLCNFWLDLTPLRPPVPFALVAVESNSETLAARGNPLSRVLEREVFVPQPTFPLTTTCPALIVGDR
ncbi:hypothetical protein CC2G_014942 [Coprinopsis cinerea AmutBmut pab1-1]|nr:hypothetical protein CC2G_014942 [Coprinopsis cinerea AmutBmut pab1-1]